jgi:uncharacterized protein
VKRLRIATGLLSFTLLAACTPPAEPTPTQIMIVQPGIEAEERGNYGFAFFTYRYWAGLRVALAQYRLGRLHEYGLGTDQDDAEAAEWYRAASDIGYAPAHAALGRLYEEGRGVPRDRATAFGLYEKAAAAGDNAAHYDAGRLLELGLGTAADPARAASHYQIAASAGNVDAQLALAELYRAGRGVPQSAALAAQWSRAAGRDVLRGPSRLARMPAEGGGGAGQQAGRALELLKADAESGVVAAYVTLGDLYAEGEVVPRDAAEAVRWYREAARRGDGEAAFRIAGAFEQGLGVYPDLVGTLAWYTIAQRQGFTPATARVEALANALPSAEVREAGRLADEWSQEFGSQIPAAAPRSTDRRRDVDDSTS